MRNTFRFTKLYSGGDPSFEEGDLFVCTVPLTQTATGVRIGPTSSCEGDKERLVEFCSEPRSRKEMMEFMGLTNRVHFLKYYVRPLLESGKIEMTKPDKPTSSDQKYKKT